MFDIIKFNDKQTHIFNIDMFADGGIPNLKMNIKNAFK